MTDEEKQVAAVLFEHAGDRRYHRAARAFLTECARKGDEYAGLPMPLEGTFLHIHPKYPWAHIFARPEPEDTAPPEEPRFNIVREFQRDGVRYIMIRNVETKRVSLMRGTARSRLQLQIETLGVVDAWEIEAEQMALQKLGTLITHRQFRSYLLTGQFLEKSERSKVHYLFRRLRPTVALSGSSAEAVPIAALCMHPIGYYENTFAGSMVPTDDIVAHLVLMRGDEREYWKQCNQHPPDAPEAAI